jgi:hypothetical protein
VEQISSKIKEYWSEGEQYDTVVLHVGTNNLVSEDPEKVAAKIKGVNPSQKVGGRTSTPN